MYVHLHTSTQINTRILRDRGLPMPGIADRLVVESIMDEVRRKWEEPASKLVDAV